MKYINSNIVKFLGISLLILISLSATGTEDLSAKNKVTEIKSKYFVEYFQKIEKAVFKLLIESRSEKFNGNNSYLPTLAAWQITVSRIDASPQPSGTQILFRMQLQCSAVDENAAYNSEVRFPGQSPTYFQLPTSHPAIESFYYDSGTDEWVIDLQDVIFAGTSLEFDILAKSPNHTTPNGETFQIDATITSDNTTSVSDIDSGAWTAAANLGIEKYLQYGPGSDALLDTPVRYYLYPCDPSYTPNAYGHLYLANWTLIDELPADVVYNNSSGTYNAGSHTVTWSDTAYLSNEDCAFAGVSNYWVEVTFPSTIYGASAMPPVLEAENIVTFEGYPLGETVIPANRMFDTDTLLHSFGLPNPIGTHTKSASTPFLGSQDKTYEGEDADFFINIRTASASTAPYYWKIIDPLPCLDYTPNAATQYESQLPSSTACGNPAYQPTDHINLYMDSRYVTISDKAAFATANPTIPLEYIGTDGSHDTLHVPHSVTGFYNIEYEISWAEILNQIPSGVGIAKLIWDSESIGVFVGVTSDNLRTAARMTLRGDVAEDTQTYPMLNAYRVRNYAYFYVDDDGTEEDSLGYIQDDVEIINEYPVLRLQKSVGETSGLITLTANSTGADFRDTDSLIMTDLLPFGYTYSYRAQEFMQLGGTGSWSWSSSNGNTNATPYAELDDVSVKNYIDVEVIDNYNGTGRQLVRAIFKKPPIATGWEGLNAFRFSFYLNQSTLNYSAVNSVEVFPTDPITVSELQCQSGFSSSPTAALSSDPNDLDGDGLTIGDAFCMDTENVTPPSSVVDLQSHKAVKGDDATATNFEPFPAVAGITVSGGSADFQINIKNTGSVGLENFVIYDILPHVGDVGLTETQVGVARGSQFEAIFDGIDMSTLPTGTVVEYSTSTTPCRDELTTGTTPFPTGCVNDWTTTLPSPISDVKALRFTFPSGDLFEFLPGEELSIEYAVTYPLGVQTGEIAWNSFAYAGDRMDDNSAILPTEPPKVGLAIPIVDLRVTKSVNKTAAFVGEPIEYTLLIDHEGAVTESGAYTPPAGTVKNVTLNDDFKTAGLKIVPSSVSIEHVTSGLANGVVFDTLTGDITIPEIGPNDAYNIIYSAYSDTEQSITNSLEIMSHPGVDDSDSTPGNGIAAEDDMDSATAAWVAPSISLKKLVETESGSGVYIEADETDGLTGIYTVGQPVNYRFIVENTGSTWLTNVTIEDNLTGFECDQTIGYMPAGDMETIDCTWSYGFGESNDPYVNIATVTGTNTTSGVIDTVSAVDSASIIVVPNCSVDIVEVYATSCQASGNVYTADWNISIDAFNHFTNAISYQRNSDAVQTHTLTGTTDTLSITGIPADGGKSDTIRVWFTDDVFCFDTYILTRPLPCPSDVATCANTSGCLGGNVFEDFNCNGTDDTNEPGVQGVQIQVYDCGNNLVGTGYSDEQGDWQVCGLTDGTAYRIEHILSDAVACWATPTHVGGDNGSDIQFVTAPACSQFSVSNPADYCADTVDLISVCFFSPDGETTDGDVLISIANQSTAGSNSTTNESEYDNPSTHSVNVPYSQIGAVWGLAYKKNTQQIFAAAYSKARSDIAPGNSLGTIYVVDNSTNDGTDANINTASTFIDLNSAAYFNGAFGNIVAGTDSLAIVTRFAERVKKGMGDLDLSDDGQHLYTINLATRQLVEMPIGKAGIAPAKSEIIVTDAPSPATCTGDIVRPFGLKFYKGLLYVGMVCTAENSQDSTNLRAYVYTYNPGSGSYSNSPVLEFRLDYDKGKTRSDIQGEWRPWLDVWDDDKFNISISPTKTLISYPQPVLSDIEFDQGDMILGFIDRLGDQHKEGPYPASNFSPNDISVIPGGDILRAGNNGNGTWTIEQNASVTGVSTGTTTTTGVDNSQGPAQIIGDNWSGNYGEYYLGDYYNEFNHQEITLGGLYQLPGEDDIITVVFDPLQPISNEFGQGGLIWLDNKTGLWEKGYRGYSGGTTNFGKGNGFADVEALCGLAPLEIGNYVWCDSIANGIQDACEIGIDNMTIQLYDATGRLVAQDTTVNGNYYFNQYNVDTTGITVDGSGVATPVTAWSGMSYNTQYFIIFGTGQFAAGAFTIGSDIYTGTTTANVNNNTNDNIDSDVDGSNLTAGGLGARPDGLPFIDMMTSATGCGDHKYDMGVICVKYDYGDLPDTSAMTNEGDYQTTSANNGPAHIIIDGLSLGSTVDGEVDGQPSSDALDDGADEDGLTIFESLDISPSSTFRLPFSYTNTTGNPAEVEGWIDWNNNGEFDSGEMFFDETDPSDAFIEITVPNDAVTGEFLGLRIRISHQDNMTPYGLVSEGEVEDYLIGIECKQQICIPINSAVLLQKK